ncbi:hypothetical protein [Sandaracinobacteroides saxicola]|uniref:Uncharacterized protein n=1 Tax=Sandaracinobacteroides saxicola TaxID=2759707 RepID=A0A7G5IFW9_9SPHN|nr:hypothetical protein [Sandaracinobacteroides saxicola]QMW22261.1 hypothetical protein H3309_12975 [Sandaracinobacteroides saxicola]
MISTEHGRDALLLIASLRAEKAAAAAACAATAYHAARRASTEAMKTRAEGLAEDVQAAARDNWLSRATDTVRHSAAATEAACTTASATAEALLRAAAQESAFQQVVAELRKQASQLKTRRLHAEMLDSWLAC